MNTQRSEDRATRILQWFRDNRRTLIGSAAVLALAAGGVWFAISAKQRREAFAARALGSARGAIQAGNLPLAASDLSRLVQSYGGTAAADEASILLAQVRLRQGEAPTAAEELQTAIEKGLDAQYLASAHGLVGAALEQQGRMKAAGDAYLQAGEAAWYDFLAAQYLNDAGRAMEAAGDSAVAAEIYERVLREYPDAPSATEARVRLAELRPSQPSIGT